MGGSIFVGMASDRVATEYHVLGHASTGAWAMLGLTIGTLGLSGAAQLTKSLYVGANATGNIVRASRMLTASNWMTGTAIATGIGFSGYMGVQSWQLFSQASAAERSGDAGLASRLRRDAWLNAGLALFPLVHIGTTLSWRSFGRESPRIEAMARMDSALDGITPGNEAPVVVKPVETPQTVGMRQLRTGQGLFSVVREYLMGDAAARAALLERLPPAARKVVSNLAESNVVRNAIQRGVTDFSKLDDLAAGAISRGIRGLGPEGPGPRGPSGLRPEAAAWTNWLDTIENLRAFLLRLSPEFTGNRAEKAAAEAALKRMRAENPEAAKIIDRLLANSKVMDDVNAGPEGARSTPQSNMALRNARIQLEPLLPNAEAEEAQQQAYTSRRPEKPGSSGLARGALRRT